MTDAEVRPLQDGPVDPLPPTGRYRLDPNHGSLTWRIGHLNLSRYTARFTRFDVVLDLDAADVERSRVRAEIDVRSVRTDYAGDKDWNGELGSDEQFFAGARAPLAVFRSTAVERLSERSARVSGDLTFRGVTAPAALVLALNGFMPDHRSGRPAIGFSGRGAIRRTVWGLDFGVGPMMRDEVEIIVEAELLLETETPA